MSRILKALILGAPGSGKGTISSRIVTRFPFVHLSSGDLLRMHIKNQTDVGKIASKYINDGQLVPDDVMIRLILTQINTLGAGSWLLDGFPRTRGQAEVLHAKQPVDIALNLNVPFQVIIDRLKSRYVHLPSGRVYNLDFNAPKVPGKDDVTGEALIQREDDRPESVLKRLTIYDEQTKPLVEFYREKGIIHEFVGRSSDEIWPQVEKTLAERLATPKQM